MKKCEGMGGRYAEFEHFNVIGELLSYVVANMYAQICAYILTTLQVTITEEEVLQIPIKC